MQIECIAVLFPKVEHVNQLKPPISIKALGRGWSVMIQASGFT